MSEVRATDDAPAALRVLAIIVAAMTVSAIVTIAAAGLFVTSDGARIRTSLTGLAVSALLGLVAVGSLVRVHRRLRRHIDERAALVAEMLDSEELYRTTVDPLVDGVVIIDTSGSVVRINESAREMFASTFAGAAPRDGEDFAGFLPQMLREDGLPFERDDRPVVRALRGDGPVIGLVAALRVDDGMRWFRCNAAATDSRDDRARRVVLTFAEITAERQMAARLDDEERRFRLALEHAPIGMALVSLDGEFITVNAALCQLTGHTDDELVELGAFGLAHPDDPPTSRDDLESLVAGERDVVSAVRRLLAADGSTVDVRIAMSIVRPDAETEPYFIVDYLDVTETVRATRAQEAALAKEQDMVTKLLQLDNTRTTFISTVSHELRTPLTSLTGYLEMLGDGTAGDISAAQLAMVDAAGRNGQRLKRLIDDLLALTAAEHPGATQRDEPIEITELLAGLVETISPIANVGGVTLSTNVGEPCSTVLGNRAELERVLINIVDNAVKFTPSGGSITIAAMCRREPRRVVEITVIDTGTGIPQHEHQHLFTRFFRSRSAQADHVPGTGLGLAIAAKLVEAHGGRISLASAEGSGTTVTIELPATVDAGTRAVETGVR